MSKKDKASKSTEEKEIYKPLNPGAFYGWPMGAWFTLFFVVPILIILLYSFLQVNADYKIQFSKGLSLKAYKYMFSKRNGILFLRTVYITLVSTAITILIALPCGYAMARSKNQTTWLILIIVPFLTNSLIRIYAWKTILGENGLVNQMGLFFYKLFHHGATEGFTPGKFIYTQGAIILVNIYLYLPYAILPIFTAVDRFDFSLLEASRDLGCSKPQSMIKILLPGIKSGLTSAIIFTLIPIFGTYTVPDLVGDKDSMMLGQFIYQKAKQRDYPVASAFSMLITIISMIGIIIMLNNNRKEAALKNGGKK